MEDRPMTFDEIFRAIRQGEMMVFTGFIGECLIMSIPVWIVGMMLWAWLFR